MKRIFILLLTVTFLFVAFGAFAVATAAEDDDSQPFEVNAVEYEDEGNEEQPIINENTEQTEQKADLIAETEKTANQETPYPNPGTGVSTLLVPMIIAGVVIVALLVVFWILKKKGYGGKKKR